MAVMADKMRVPKTLWRAIEAIGLEPSIVLKQAAMPLTLHQRPEAVVTTTQLFAVFIALETLSPSPALSLRLSKGMSSSKHTPVFLAATYARSYRESLLWLHRFERLGACEEIVIEALDDQYALIRRWPFATEPEPRLLAETWCLFATELGRRGTGQRITPIRVDIKSRGEPDQHFVDYFRCPIRYGAPRTQVLMHAEDLDRSFLGQNLELLELVTPALKAALRVEDAHATMVDRIKAALKGRLAGGWPEVSEVARHLAMSARTMQRRIEEEGTSFSQILTDVRRELGRQLLSKRSVDIEEVAFLLGFKDTSSFYRAFREWEDMTPAEWRRINCAST